jgi:hypothetical protein
MVQPWHLELVSKPGFRFCRSTDCEVVYFHPDGDHLRKPDVRVRVGLKETADPVPICYCFGFTEALLAQEIRETGECSIPRRIAAEVKAGNCACEARNPQGSCCLGHVASAVIRLKSGRANPDPRPAISGRSSQIRTVVKLRVLSLIAILGAGIFATAEIVQPFYRSDRALSDPYSTYVVGEYGFVQTTAFIVLSVGSLALSLGFTPFRGSAVRWRVGRILLAVWSVGVLMAAIFPIAGGPLPASAGIHGLASMLSFLSIIAGMLVLSQAFERDARWQPFAFSSWLLTLAGGGSFVLAAIIHHPTCFAILQRIFLGTIALWIGAASARMHKLALDGGASA